MHFVSIPRLWPTVISGLVAQLLVLGTIFAVHGNLTEERAAADTREPAFRRIEIVAESMAFTVNRINNNPTFSIWPGETVEFHVVNRDAGMVHDLAIPELGVKTPPLKEGEDVFLLVIFPVHRIPIRYEYLCTFHPVSMKGWIEVDAEKQ